MDQERSFWNGPGIVVVTVGIVVILGLLMGADGILGIIATAFVFIVFIALILSYIVGSKDAKKEELYLKFLDKCHEANIYQFETEREIQKGSLIANSLNLNSSNLQKLYDEAYALFQRNETAKENLRLETIRQEERKLYNSCVKYAGMYGREKQIAMLTDARKEAKKKAEEARMANHTLRSMVTKSESNWAVAGGLVSGVAGPIAGALTAFDTEARNIQVRAQNQANLNAVAPMLYSFNGNAAAHEAQANKIAEMIEDTKVKLISKDSPMECLGHLRFSNIEISVSETGTCFVKVKASVPKDIIIFGDTQAAVDGEIIANIYDNDKKLGSATMVLPAIGIPGRSSVTLMGICLFCGGSAKGKAYNLKFSANNLWLIEQNTSLPKIDTTRLKNSNSDTSLSKIDITRLRKDLVDYYETELYNGFSAAQTELVRVQKASDDELIKAAQEEGFDLNDYAWNTFQVKSTRSKS